MASAAAPVLVERADIHKSCRALESIISILASYTEAANTVAVIQRKLSKALRDAANVKGTNNVATNAMTSSAGVFECFAEVDAKYAKIVDKETENAGNDLKKWFKKLAKEEKAHDERTAIANNKIKQAGQTYEKKAKRKDRDAVDEHSRYVAVLNAVGPEMSKDKYNHALLVTQRHTSTLSSFAASLSRLAEAEWIRACEHVRKSAPSIGIVGEWRVLCESGWSDPLPSDLPDISNYDDVEKIPAVSTDATPPAQPVRRLTTGGDIALVVKQAESPESPTGSFNSKLAQPTPISSEGQHSADPPGSYPHGSRPGSPSVTREVVSHPPKELSNTKIEQVPVSAPAVAKQASKDESESPTTSPQSAIPGNRVVASTKLDGISRPTDHVSDKGDVEISNSARKRLEHDLEDTSLPGPNTIHSPRSLPVPPSRDFLNSEFNRMNPANTFNVDSEEDDRDRRKQFVAFPEGTKPIEGGGNVGVGASLHRRSSVESNNSLVAAMRERYDTRPLRPSSPPPREPPRLVPKVSDLTTRYGLVDTRTSPRSSGSTSAQSGLTADRFPTFQDKYPRSNRDRDRHRVPLDSPTLERDYFEPRDNERSRYSDVPTMDRSYGDAHDRRRYHSRSPDRQYFDELGMRERQRNIDTIQEELALQEREANLRRQERQLEIERAKLASAREGGYASDASRSHDGSSAYGRLRRSESPGPMTSQQSLRPPPPQNAAPYDHSPNCGCQRCSARHYASPPSPSPADRDSLVPGKRSPVVYKPDPPIVLRPEKPKNWLRRMSMPVASLVSPNDKKTPELPGTVGRGKTDAMTLPGPDERIRRRSFELEHPEESSPRFGGTTRR